MKTLYIANRNYSSWSLRPWLMMRELGLEFQENLIPFGRETDWHSYRQLGGSGKVPMLVDDDRMVWDSLAIIETLADDHREVWPADASARAWARSACAEMHAEFQTLREICTMNIRVTVRLREIPDALQRDIDRVTELWQQGLDRFGGPFLAGKKFSAVDAFFAPVVYRFRGYQLAAPEPCRHYLERMLALPSMREWEQAALAETWREADHEQQTLHYGELVEDRRAATIG